MLTSTKQEIESILSTFLKGCDIIYDRDWRLDQSFRDACYADATRRNFDLKLLAKDLDVGIVFTDSIYRHLENYSTRVFLGLWLGLLSHIDDASGVYTDGLKEFSSRFIRQEPQLHPVLDKMAEMSRELSEHWNGIEASLILTGQLDFFTSTVIDSMIQDMDVEYSMTPGFPQFMRLMSGSPNALLAQAFPRDLDIKEWIQIMPDAGHWTLCVNDLLSFYKEELEGEDINFVSMSAKAKGISKIEVLRQLADDHVECYRRGINLLQSSPKALEAFKNYCAGYVTCHAVGPRYKLDQLCL